MKRLLIVLISASMAIVSASAQAPKRSASPATTAASTIPRTADGKPDFTGNWTNATITPFERVPNRPLIIIITGINILVTFVFRADVDAQGGAYATGVLVLMSSAAVAVAISEWRQPTRWAPFFAIAAVFFYTTVTNMAERPEGIKIASLFILAIVSSSLVSRALRSTELRVHGFVLDDAAEVAA